MKHWPEFQSHKFVRAAKIMGFDTNDTGLRISATVDPGNGQLEPFKPSMLGMLDSAEIGWYAIVYRDGYKSICPATEFEDGYRMVERNEEALES